MRDTEEKEDTEAQDMIHAVIAVAVVVIALTMMCVTVYQTYGVQIHVVNVWEAIFANACKFKENSYIGFIAVN